MLTNILFYVSSAINPVLYNLVSTNFRQIFFSTFISICLPWRKKKKRTKFNRKSNSISSNHTFSSQVTRETTYWGFDSPKKGKEGRKKKEPELVKGVSPAFRHGLQLHHRMNMYSWLPSIGMNRCPWLTLRWCSCLGLWLLWVISPCFVMSIQHRSCLLMFSRKLFYPWSQCRPSVNASFTVLLIRCLGLEVPSARRLRSLILVILKL